MDTARLSVFLMCINKNINDILYLSIIFKKKIQYVEINNKNYMKINNNNFNKS